jgi:hypothetical protein
MSGFLPDLASWALRGQAAQDAQPAEPPPQPLTMEEVRAQRLARMEAAQHRAAAAPEPMEVEPEPMEIDTTTTTPAEETAAPVVKLAPVVVVAPVVVAAPVAAAPVPPPTAPASPPKNNNKKKKTESVDNSTRKLQRKKELLLKKVLAVTLVGGSVSGDASTVAVDLDGTTEISVQSTAEILVSRLSLMEASKSILSYLGACHRRAVEEAKSTLPQKSPELSEILQEIQRQVVSYAASCLMVPGLFPAAEDAPLQLATCLQSGEVTFGGTTTSFYYLLCEELFTQDAPNFTVILSQVVTCITKQLATVKSVLDGTSTALVQALAAACSHKRACAALTSLPAFLLPPAGSPEAAQLVRPAGQNILQQMLGADQTRAYLKRSGPALEKDTLLGQVLQIGLPRSNSAFSPVVPRFGPTIHPGTPQRRGPRTSVTLVGRRAPRQCRCLRLAAGSV